MTDDDGPALTEGLSHHRLVIYKQGEALVMICDFGGFNLSLPRGTPIETMLEAWTSAPRGCAKAQLIPESKLNG